MNIIKDEAVLLNKIKRKAEQIACNEAINFINLNDNIII
jgi:hypothetical protein